MTTHFPQFAAIYDRIRFPLLAAGGDSPVGHLMGCRELTFFAPENAGEVASVILKEPLQWHQYGDARWPSPSSWIEIETSPGGYQGATGILTVCCQIPEHEPDPYRWVAEHGPLIELFPEERSDSMILRKTDALRQQAAKAEDSDDELQGAAPRFVQSYCIYRGSGDVQLIATYTDLLSGDGIPIPRFRMANLQDNVVSLCRFALHALFRLNQARIAGMGFVIERQLTDFGPMLLPPSEKDAPWARFHPSRVLRTRPAVRALPSPRDMMNGIMSYDTVNEVMAVRRCETNLQLLAFHRDVRPRASPADDNNATLAAFIHRANGGSIYVLPDPLVEEFDHTDCHEVRIGEVRLPFNNLFVKFTPPLPLTLESWTAVMS